MSGSTKGVESSPINFNCSDYLAGLQTGSCHSTQNTRLSYLRTIKLGGQKEKLYNETNIYAVLQPNY